jgi:predicted dehydrogenase
MKSILIGLGDISEKHIKVLKEFHCEITGVYSRDYEETKLRAKKLGITNIFKTFEEVSEQKCDFFLIMTSAENNCKVLKQFIPLKKPILIEKPVGFSSHELDEAIELNKKFCTPIMVGANRRFYSIFHSALEYLNSKNLKINSIYIEAPERINDINKDKFSFNTKQHWMFVNSIHCIDLLRFFSGDVKNITSFSNVSKLVFNAIGISEKNIEFIYNSNWSSPGKWTISIYADETRIEFDPLESGKIITKNSVIEITPSENDLKFKPGFYFQFKHFLENIVGKNQFVWPCSDLIDHKKSLETIEKIFPTTLDIPFKK